MLQRCWSTLVKWRPEKLPRTSKGEWLKWSISIFEKHAVAVLFSNSSAIMLCTRSLGSTAVPWWSPAATDANQDAARPGM